MDALYRMHFRWLHIYPNGDVKVYTRKKANPDPGCVVLPLRIKVPSIDEREPLLITLPSSPTAVEIT